MVPGTKEQRENRGVPNLLILLSRVNGSAEARFFFGREDGRALRSSRCSDGLPGLRLGGYSPVWVSAQRNRHRSVEVDSPDVDVDSLPLFSCQCTSTVPAVSTYRQLRIFALQVAARDVSSAFYLTYGD